MTLFRRVSLVLEGFLAVLLFFCLAMTWSRIATPIVNKGLEWWGPENSHVERARLRFPQLYTLSVEQGDIGKYGGLLTADLTYNPIGFIPGLAWFPKIEGQDGRFIIPLRDPKADVKGNLQNITMDALALSGLAKGSIEGDFELISIGSELAGLDIGEAFMLLLVGGRENRFHAGALRRACGQYQ